MAPILASASPPTVGNLPMTLNPISVVHDVIEEYKSYLRTEFRARDSKLREALDRELNAPGFLAQEPFFQAHRPFKPGRSW